MIRIEQAVDVEADAASAFAFVTRLEDYPAWLPGILRAEPVDIPVAGGTAASGLLAGPEFRLVSAGPGGMEIAALGRVEASDPPRSVTIRAASPLFDVTGTCLIEALDGARSRIAVRAEIQPRGLAILAAGRIEQELRAAVPDAMVRLRRAVEDGSRAKADDGSAPGAPDGDPAPGAPDGDPAPGAPDGETAG